MPRQFYILLAVTMLFLSAQLPAMAEKEGEVAGDHWAYSAVERLHEKGLIEDYREEGSEGIELLTRSEFADIVAEVWEAIDRVIPQTGHGTPVNIFDGQDGVFTSPIPGMLKWSGSPDDGSDNRNRAPMIKTAARMSIMTAFCLRGDKRGFFLMDGIRPSR